MKHIIITLVIGVVWVASVFFFGWLIERHKARKKLEASNPPKIAAALPRRMHTDPATSFTHTNPPPPTNPPGPKEAPYQKEGMLLACDNCGGEGFLHTHPEHPTCSKCKGLGLITPSQRSTLFRACDCYTFPCNHNPVFITINARPVKMGKAMLTYDQIVEIATGWVSRRKHPTVTFKKPSGENAQGTMVPGDAIKIVEGIIFNVAET